MGRFLAGVLFLAACVGDRPAVDPGAPGGGGENTSGSPGGVTKLAPQQCGDLSWQVAVGGEVDFAAIARGQEMQVLSVPLAGGPVSAFSFGKGGTVAPSVQIGSGMTSVSASLIGNYLVGTSSDASSIHISVLTPDLSQALPIAQVAPGLVAKSAFQIADWKMILPVADDQGLRIETFDQTLTPTPIRVATTEPALAMTAAPMQYATVAAWSTVSSCHMMTLYTAAAGPMITVPGACLAPALAIDPTTELGVLAYEGDDGIRMIGWEHQNVVGVSQLISLGGSSPHALFDGQRIWISLLDANDNIVVGYVSDGRFVATTLATHPLGGAYDLIMMDGNVWTVANEHDQFTAQRLCIEPTNG